MFNDKWHVTTIGHWSPSPVKPPKPPTNHHPPFWVLLTLRNVEHSKWLKSQLLANSKIQALKQHSCPVPVSPRASWFRSSHKSTVTEEGRPRDPSNYVRFSPSYYSLYLHHISLILLILSHYFLSPKHKLHFFTVGNWVGLRNIWSCRIRH